MTRATWLADVLRAEGLKVVEHDGWETRGHGGFTDLRAVVWHHDASAIGDSPGVPAYMLREWDTHGAQLWVDRRGVWHILAAGVAYHAGKVLPGMPSNRTSLGVESDHTTGEDWPPALLRSLRVGTAAILRRIGQDATGLHFHRTICSPVGRKSDPDGLDLDTERGRVAVLMATRPHVKTTAPSPKGPPMLIVKNPDGNDQWLTCLGRRWRIATTAELAAYEKVCPRVTLDAAAFARLVDA